MKNVILSIPRPLADIEKEDDAALREVQNKYNAMKNEIKAAC